MFSYGPKVRTDTSAPFDESEMIELSGRREPLSGQICNSWGSDEVHVWCAPTGVSVDVSSLSCDELARADRLRSPGHRRRWIASRVFLRTVLSAYLGCRRERLELCYSQQGKPALHHGSLRFNLSHSGDLAVCAVCHSREIGVDIEQIRCIPNMDDIVRSICSPAERTVWNTLDVAQQPEAFFNCWTVKESCAKALGTGLATRVDSIEALTNSGYAHVIRSHTREWTILRFAPAAGYVGALAVEGRFARMVLR